MADKVPSITEFKDMLRKEIKEEAKKYVGGIQDRVEEIKNARPEDLSQIVKDKFADGGGVSYSSLKSFRKSPLSFIEYLTTPFVQTEAMFKGNVVDTMVTEPEKFSDIYYLTPALSRRSNRDKAIYELYQELAGDKIVLDRDLYEECVRIAEGLFKNDDARFYLERTINPQKWISFVHKPTGIKYRGKIDGESARDIEDCPPFILDLKTAADADVDPFQRNAAKMWYQGQVAGYTLAYKSKWDFRDFIHVVVETKAPYNVNVYRSDSRSDYVKEAQEEFNYTMLSVKYCLDNNLWHKSYDFIRAESLKYEAMRLPGYYKPKFSDGTK